MHRDRQEKRHAHFDQPVSSQHGHLGHAVNSVRHTITPSCGDLAQLLASWRFYVPSDKSDFYNIRVGVHLHNGGIGIRKVNKSDLGIKF